MLRGEFCLFVLLCELWLPLWGCSAIEGTKRTKDETDETDSTTSYDDGKPNAAGRNADGRSQSNQPDHTYINGTALVVLGGKDLDGKVYRYVEVIHLKTQDKDMHCKVPKKYPHPVFGSNSFVYNGTIVVCGGRIGRDVSTAEYTNDCNYLDNRNNEWKPFPKIEIAFAYGASVKKDDKIWLTGGSNGNSHPTNDLDISSLLRKDKWHPGPALPGVVHGHCMVNIDDHRTAILGTNYNPARSLFWVYNWKTSEWDKKLPPFHREILYAFCGMDKQRRLVVAGGREVNSHRSFKDVGYFDFDAKSWAQGPDLPSPNEGELVSPSSTELVAIGGAEMEMTDVLLKLDDTEWKALPQKVKVPRMHSSRLAVPKDSLPCGQFRTTTLKPTTTEDQEKLQDHALDGDKEKDGTKDEKKEAKKDGKKEGKKDGKKDPPKI